MTVFFTFYFEETVAFWRDLSQDLVLGPGVTIATGEIVMPPKTRNWKCWNRDTCTLSVLVPGPWRLWLLDSRVPGVDAIYKCSMYVVVID